MKKLFTALLCATMILGLAGCGGGGKEAPKEESKKYVAESDIKNAYSNPEKYKGMYIKLTGKVFSTPEKDEDGIYFQMWGDPENNDLNTVVGYANAKMELKANDYVIVEGKIVDKYEGENAFGGSIMALQILADDVKVASYSEIVSPTNKTVTPSGLVNSQNGVDIAVTKVEFAKNETRIYYSVSNNSGSNYSFYDFNMKLVQDGKQYEEQRNYEADYPSVSGDILNGIKSEGIIAFPKLEQKNFSIYFSAGYSDNYDLDFTEFTFDVAVE